MPVVLSLAVVGFIWKSVMWSPSQGLFNVLLNRTAQGNQIDWVGNAEKIFAFHVPGPRHAIGAVEELRRAPDRHGVAAHRLRDGAVSRRAEERRSLVARGRSHRWLQRVAELPAVVFPVMKPINVVVLRHHGDQALRAFDIIFALKKPPGTQVLGILVRDNLVGEGGGQVGLGSAYG